MFGERNSAHDFHYREELQALRQAGLLEFDMAWSRDGGAARYVQDLLPAHADKLRSWVADGAAIYVCGSLQGMAAGVDQALLDILGREAVERLIEQGRYRRDVY